MKENKNNKKNEFLKFAAKGIVALFALGVGAKLGQDAIEHGKKV